MKEQEKVFRELKKVTRELIRCGLAEEYNYPVIQQMDIVWEKYQNISLYLRNMDYSTIYDEIEKNHNYNVKLPDGDVLNIVGNKTVVAVDYEIVEEVKYDFVIKQVGKDEITESIFKEVQKIDGDYSLVNGVYSNKPDLTGFNANYTRYMYENDQKNMALGNWITDDQPQNWYSYKDSKWANLYVESGGPETYYVWIPRYQYKLNQTNQRAEVKFILGTGTEKDPGYQIPEAFWWDKNDNGQEDDGEQLTGYWMSKYQLSN